MLLSIRDVIESELVDVASILDCFSHCEVDDILFVAVDDLAYLVGVDGHHVFDGEFLVGEDVMMELGKGEFLEDAEFTSLSTLEEAIEGVGYLHLDVQGLVLLQEVAQET